MWRKIILGYFILLILFAGVLYVLHRTGFQLRPVPLENAEISERNGGYTSFIILADAYFSQDTIRVSAIDLPIACGSRAREPGSAPPNRSASEVRSKTVEIDSSGPPVVDLPVPPLA
jgi:hypothetical protein